MVHKLVNIYSKLEEGFTVQYLFLCASGAPNSRAATGSPHSSYATGKYLCGASGLLLVSYCWELQRINSH